MGDKYNVSSINQMGGITAGQVNVGHSPRTLDSNSRSSLTQHLDKSEPVDLTAVMGDAEAFRFATEIKAYLESQGYDVNGVNQAVYSQPIQGQIIEPRNKVIIGSR